MKELEELLKFHDWYYEYSDDHNVWLKGNKQSKVIKDKMKELGNTQEVKDLYNKYST